MNGKDRRHLVVVTLGLIGWAGLAEAQQAPQAAAAPVQYAQVPSDRFSPTLGISYRFVRYGRGFGAVLTRNAAPGSPMSQIRLERGDMITHLDNQPIYSAADLESHHSQTSVAFVNIRTNQLQSEWVALPFPDAPPAPPAPPDQPWQVITPPNGQYSLGVTASQVSVSTGVQYTPQGGAISATRQALRVQSVAPGSAAALAGVRVGDVILSAGPYETHNITDLRTAIANSGGALQLKYMDSAANSHDSVAYMGGAPAAPAAAAPLEHNVARPAFGGP